LPTQLDVLLLATDVPELLALIGRAPPVLQHELSEDQRPRIYDLLPPRRAQPNWMHGDPVQARRFDWTDRGETEEFLGRGGDLDQSSATTIVTAHVATQATGQVKIDPR
jgi:hypothetical protein